MPIKTQLWTVGDTPEKMSEGKLPSEKMLEDMIVHSPELLSDEWLLIGRQEKTAHGGIIDLLALAQDGSLVLIELKREQTPREVVAQALDYASWVQGLGVREIHAVYSRFIPSGDLAKDFELKFGCRLEDESINQSHQIIIVAASIDGSTERIVNYLSCWDIPINVLCFQVFEHKNGQLLGRTWLLDPAETQVHASEHVTSSDKEPWNGEFYCSFGEGMSRRWEEAVEYGFFCAGGGSWYSNTLRLLQPGARIWVKAIGHGFVGVGIVTGTVTPASSFVISTPNGESLALDVLKKGSYHREYVDDQSKCEYFVAVEWLETLSLDQAIKEVGLFGNQNSVCRPKTEKWQSTIEYLKARFHSYDKNKRRLSRDDRRSLMSADIDV